MNQKTVGKVLKDIKLNLPASNYRGKKRVQESLQTIKPDQLWETYKEYISTESRMTYLM